MLHTGPYGPMDKAPAYGAGDSGFESQYGLTVFFSGLFNCSIIVSQPGQDEIC